MKALIIGILLIGFGVYALLPMGLNWGGYVLDFLMGGAPILAFLIGALAFLIGVADIKDKAAEKRDEKKS